MSLVFDRSAELNLVLWGDPQVTDLLHPDRVRSFRAACETVRAAEGRADAILIAGDVAEFGREADYRVVSAALGAAAENADCLLIASGNHDVRIRPFRRQHCRFRAFLCGVPNAVQTPYDRYWYSHEIRGIPFFVMGADRNSFESAWISKAQLRALDETLARAEAQGKPAFVLNHQPLRRTNGLPLTWEGRGNWRGGVGMQNNSLREILTSHGRVFYLTGHLHYGTSEYNVEQSGPLTMVAAPTVACPNHGPSPAPGQGFTLALYQDRLAGTAWDFVRGEPLDVSVPNARFEIAL